ADVFTAERAFDARGRERSRHHTLEFPAAAELDVVRRTSEVPDDADQQLIALLPVAADHVKRQPGSSAAPRRDAVERHVRFLGDEASRLERYFLGTEPVNHLAGNRHVLRERQRSERPPLVLGMSGVRGARGGEGGRHRRYTGRGRHDEMTIAAMLAKMT